VEKVVAEGAEAVPPAAGSGEGGGTVGHGGEARRGFGLILVEMERSRLTWNVLADVFDFL
jgi:hypothetical protein